MALAPNSRLPLRLPRRPRTLSAQVFTAFLVVLVTFGGVTAYGAYTARRLADEVTRVVKGYLTVGLELHDLQTRQGNLVLLLDRSADEWVRLSVAEKSAIDLSRRYRKVTVRRARQSCEALLADAQDDDERAFLREVSARLASIEGAFDEQEELFNKLFGPSGARPMIAAAMDVAARGELRRREDTLHRKDLGELAQEFRGRVQRAEARLASQQARAVWATVILAVLAAALGLVAMALVQRALSPLRRLSASAKQIARGDYRQRVEVGRDDEVGALASEFNAMAGALEEREARLIRSERLAGVGRMAAQITHEVRNPLSSIGLNAELLEEELRQFDGSGGAQELARAIVKEVDRLGEITEEYLRFARLPQPRLEREDLNALLSSLLSFLRHELDGRRVSVRATLDGSLPPVAIDENQIRQALLNLLRNGAEAMAGKGGGTLAVTTERATTDGPPLVIIRIADEGDGIAAEHRARIFEPFFTTKRGGTGLGLSLTQQIVLEHGGSIEVASEPGRGAVFTVRLPAAPAEPEGQALASR